MSTPALLTTVLITSFVATLLSTKILLRKFDFLHEKKPKESSIFFGQDMAKAGKIFVPTMGGLAITFGFIFSVLLSLRFIGEESSVNILAALVTILLIAIIGLLDDVLIVRKVWRMLLPAIAALPLIAINTGMPKITIFSRQVELGVFYVYLLVPVAVIACANLMNILAGFNGLEAGTGAIACFSIFSASLIMMKLEPGKYHIAAPIIMLAMFGACLAFLAFNWYPARIFPGNIGTYIIGASIAASVIIGNIEKAGLIVLTPQIMEFFLKMRSGFRVGVFGTLVDGNLVYKDKVFSLTHLFMKYMKVDEKRLVLYLMALQVFFGLMAVWSVFWYRKVF